MQQVLSIKEKGKFHNTEIDSIRYFDLFLIFWFIGAWGALPKGEKSEDVTTSQVRIPAKFVSRLIGERGKTITEICRDSKTKVNIPRVTDDTSVVVTITGSKINILLPAHHFSPQTIRTIS